jgi:hypothetical protein
MKLVLVPLLLAGVAWRPLAYARRMLLGSKAHLQGTSCLTALLLPHADCFDVDVCVAVYCAQVTNGLSDALLRASAERAEQAVLMAPLTLQDESADDRLSEKVMTGAWGRASVLHV